MKKIQWLICEIKGNGIVRHSKIQKPPYEPGCCFQSGFTQFCLILLCLGHLVKPCISSLPFVLVYNLNISVFGIMLLCFIFQYYLHMKLGMFIQILDFLRLFFGGGAFPLILLSFLLCPKHIAELCTLLYALQIEFNSYLSLICHKI